MKTISLSQGLFALVDDEDFEKLSKHKWCAVKGTTTYYAVRHLPGPHKNRKRVYMHRVIMGITDPNIEVDHKDHNGLNNQRDNLRVCTTQQNQYNQKIYKSKAISGYKGVHYHLGKWQALICANGKSKYLGRFSSPIHAALAYNIAALNLHGEFACVNELPLT